MNSRKNPPSYNQDKYSISSTEKQSIRIDKDIEYREIQIESLEKQLGPKRKRTSRSISKKLKGVLQHADLSDDDLIALYEEKERLEKGSQELEQIFFSSRETISKSWKKKSKYLRKNKELSDTLLNELKDQKNNYHLELNAIKERLSIEFSFDIRELQDPNEIDEDENELSERIKKIKKQLDEFGAINPMAMEAYQEMNDRYQFIKSEKN